MNKKEEIKIKPALSKDKDWVIEQVMNDLLAREKLGIELGTHEDLTVKNDSWNITFIVTSKDKNIGFVKTWFDSSQNFAELKSFYLIKEYRGKGIAKQVMSELIPYIKETWPITYIMAMTVQNEPMDKLLSSYGFEYRGTIKRFRYHGGSFKDYSFYFYKL